jgi:hypothetical protein
MEAGDNDVADKCCCTGKPGALTALLRLAETHLARLVQTAWDVLLERGRAGSHASGDPSSHANRAAPDGSLPRSGAAAIVAHGHGKVGQQCSAMCEQGVAGAGRQVQGRAAADGAAGAGVSAAEAACSQAARMLEGLALPALPPPRPAKGRQGAKAPVPSSALTPVKPPHDKPSVKAPTLASARPLAEPVQPHSSTAKESDAGAAGHTQHGGVRLIRARDPGRGASRPEPSEWGFSLIEPKPAEREHHMVHRTGEAGADASFESSGSSVEHHSTDFTSHSDLSSDGAQSKRSVR